MKTQHTPGPWIYVHSSKNIINSNRPRVVTDIHTICEFTFDSKILELAECDANARLIAAAPELLEALKKINSLLDDEFQSKDELVPPSIVEAYNIIENVTKNL